MAETVHEVHKLEVNVPQYFTDEEIRLLDPQIEVRQEFFIKGLQASLSGYVLAGCPREFYHMVAYPASWWQHFKRDVISKLTANPVTSWGKKLDRWARYVKLTRDEKIETFYANICPHGVVQPREEHMSFLWREYSDE